MMKKMMIYILPLFVCVFMLLNQTSAQLVSADSCLFPDRAVTIYGQKICPDKFNQDDDFEAWDVMADDLDVFLPGGSSGEETKTAPQVCEHIRNLQSKYSASTENYIFKLQTGLASGQGYNEKVNEFVNRFRADESQYEHDAPFDLFVLKIFNSEETFQEMLSLYPEESQMQIRAVKGFLDTTRHLTVLHDSVLDNCPKYAQEKGYYKILNYNGPDAGYRVEDDPGWEAVRQKWEQNEKRGIVE